MGMLGNGALAMWWDIDDDDIAEFERWHSNEHIPERVSLPGFLRGGRWRSENGAGSYFVLYETRDVSTLRSAPYMQRLNDPTPWSTQMFPRFRNMVRSICAVRASFGRGVGRAIATARITPEEVRETELCTWLVDVQFPALASRLGIVGAHVLQNQPLPATSRTREETLRGGDSAANWVILVEGDNATAIRTLIATELSEHSLTARGAKPAALIGQYDLAFLLSSADVQNIQRVRTEPRSEAPC